MGVICSVGGAFRGYTVNDGTVFSIIHKIEQLPHLALFNSAEDSKEPGDIGQFTVFHHFGKGHLDPPLGVLEVCILRNFLECVRIA